MQPASRLSRSARQALTNRLSRCPQSPVARELTPPRHVVVGVPSVTPARPRPTDDCDLQCVRTPPPRTPASLNTRLAPRLTNHRSSRTLAQIPHSRSANAPPGHAAGELVPLRRSGMELASRTVPTPSRAHAAPGDAHRRDTRPPRGSAVRAVRAGPLLELPADYRATRAAKLVDRSPRRLDLGRLRSLTNLTPRPRDRLHHVFGP